MENEFLTTGLDAIRQASKIILSYFNNLKTNEVQIKSDGSPVTIADKEAEQLIKKIILKKFPDHSFIGEEGSSVENKSKYTWVLDPIDGTRYFSRGLPYFTTELALVNDNKVIVSISHNHATNQTLTAIKNSGAYLNKKERLQVSSTTDFDKSFVSAGSIKHFEELQLTQNLVKLNRDVSQLRGLEESRAYSLFCQGTIDCVIMAKGWSWDFAAASLIFEESGAKVTTLSGEKLDFYSKEPQSLLAANPTLHVKIIKYFSR